MSSAAVVTLLVLLVGLVLLVAEWLATGVVGLLMIVALVLFGVLTPEQAFEGLVDPAVIAVAGMFVISAGIQRTGAISFVANQFTSRGGGSSGGAYVVLVLIVMVLSAFMNNTPLVLVFLPVVLGLSIRMGEPPSKLLMPLSYLSILGGMCTLVGTSTNLVVAGALAKVTEGRESLGMFDFTPLGVILAAVGAVFVMLFRKRLLPDRVSLGLLSGKGIATEYMTEIEIPAGSRLAGQAVESVFTVEGDTGTVRVLQLIRDSVIRRATPQTVLEAGDRLLIKGDPAGIVDARRKSGAELESDSSNTKDQRIRTTNQTLFEVVVAPNCSFLGRRIKNARFRERYDASVFALQRHGEHHQRSVEDVRLKAGDVLLVQGAAKSIESMKASDDLLVVEGVHQQIPHTHRAPIALVSIGVFVALAVSGIQSVAMAAVIAGLIMVLGRCLSPGEAYSALAWDVLLLIAGTLAVAEAFRMTGLAHDAAKWISEACGPLGTHACLAAMFLFTTALTQLLSNNAAAAIMTPLAFETGVALEGVGWMPFVMAVAFASSCAFLTPIAYQTNLLVYGPGGYRFSDFMRLGLPLTIIFAVVATLLLPVIY